MIKKAVAIFLCIVNLCILGLCMPANAAESEDSMLPLLREMQIMVGDADGNLRLDDAVSRAEFSKVAVAASVYKNSVALNLKMSPYKDVNHQHWAAPYIKLASDNRLVNGYPDSSFRPENTVLYEEALNIFLKLLGYSDADFGSSWPYGQVGLAINIGLCDGLDKSIGETLTRRDVAYLTYNLLTALPKNSSSRYITTLNYNLMEDVVLLGTPLTDSSVGSGRINTTSGNFKCSVNLDELVGRKGDLIIKNTSEAVGFIPSKQYIEEYLVYQILENDIVVSDHGALKSLSMDDNLTVYHKSQTTTLKNARSGISIGDTLKIYKTSDMVTDYGMLATELLQGPITAVSQSVITTDAQTTFIRNGVQSGGFELNDILYYSKQLNTVWAYSKRVSGIYESASPNRDNPTAVTVSGTVYSLEGTEAFYKLSSKGSLQYGDSVTLLLGRDGKVADVLSGVSESVVGYLVETGKKSFTSSSGSEYSSYYVALIRSDGERLEYPTSSDYSSSKNKICKVTFQNQKATLARLNTDASLSGIFDWSSRTLGGKKLSGEINIMDISTMDSLETGSYVKVYPQRIDGIRLSGNDVLYYERNSAGEIHTLFLNNVTGDAQRYGIVISASDYTDRSNSRTYTYDIDGMVATVNGSIFPAVSSGAPSKFAFSGERLSGIAPLSKFHTPLSEITDFTVTCNGLVYTLSDKAVFYIKGEDYRYLKASKSDLISQQKNYTVYAYYDKDEADGGRIRVLVAVKKPI